MDVEQLSREAELADDIRMHIEECDRMYSEIHGCCTMAPECNVCKKLLRMGFHLTAQNLPDICIHHCERWRLCDPDDTLECPVANPPVGLPEGVIPEPSSRSDFNPEAAPHEPLPH